MIRINVRPEIKFKANYKPFLRYLSAVFLVSFLFYFSMYSWGYIIKAEAESINKINSTKRNQLEEMRKDLNKLERLQASIKDKKQRMEEIRSLNQRRKDPIFMLDNLQRKHMEMVWIEKIAYQINEMKILLIASAKDPSIVADYVARLRLGIKDSHQSITDYLNFEPNFLKDAQEGPAVEIDLPKVQIKSVVLKDSNEFQVSQLNANANFQRFNLEILLENK